MSLTATVNWIDLAVRTWDAAVVGAGPAGSLAARQLARCGLAVLLIDKAAFPRAKVCGCCLNGSALATLEAVGLGDLPRQLGAVPLTQTRIAVRGSQASVRLPCGKAVSRTEFDGALVQAAVDAGVSFLPDTTARITGVEGNTRTLDVRQPSRAERIAARVVLAADGLGGRALAADSTFPYHTRPSSRMGAGTVIERAPVFYRSGTIFLAIATGGYVGLVRLEDGRLDLAAALDRKWIRFLGSPGAVAASILKEVGWPSIDELTHLAWRGTALLTRRPAHLAAERLFLLGDAAGYIEPFTGEGMAWAAASAVAVAPLAREAARGWRQELIGEWTQHYRRCVGRRQRSCRFIARGLRHPLLVRAALKLLAYWPELATPVLHRLNAPPCHLEGCAP